MADEQGDSAKTSEELVPAPAPAASGSVARMPIDRVPVQLGIAPRSLEEGWRLAQMMAKSSLVPKGFQNKPEDVLVAIQLGIEIGLAPMQSLQSIAVINGRPSVWGDGFLALIMGSSVYQDHDEYYEVGGARVDGLTGPDLQKDTTAAVCTFLRRGKTTPVTQRFTVGMAKKAGLLTKEGPWQNYPDRMLKLRARSWAGRDAFPDVLRGITTAEEAMDIPPAAPEPASMITFPTRKSVALPESTPAAETARAETETVAKPAATEFSPGVLIKDISVSRSEGRQTAVIVDEHGVTYKADDPGIILAAKTAMDKGYRMEISSVRRDGESFIEEINKARTDNGQ